MNPVTNHEIGKARHKEIEAEFARVWSEASFGETTGQSRTQRLVMGLGSILLGLFMIIQSLAF